MTALEIIENEIESKTKLLDLSGKRISELVIALNSALEEKRGLTRISKSLFDAIEIHSNLEIQIEELTKRADRVRNYNNFKTA